MMSRNQEDTSVGSDRSDDSEPAVGHRPARIVLACLLLPTCWLGMMIVHEAGHVAGVWVTGGTVTRVVLHPLAISRTDVAPNPNPLLVAWAGPVIGLLLPIALWSILAIFRSREAFLARFFAGFCAVANGLYLGIGSFERVGDAGDLLRSGASIWHLWLFGALTTVAGFRLWSGQARSFGFGPDAHRISWRPATTVSVLLTTILVLELALN